MIRRAVYLGVIITLFGISGSIFASQDNHTTDSLAVYTDRNLYISGESIFFSSINLSGAIEHSEILSRILYVELITPDGVRLTGGKFEENNGKCAGTLHIPKDMVTGLYYLKCYTRSMRNVGPSAYTFTPVKVINPLKSEILSVGRETAGNYPEVSLKSAFGLSVSLNDSVFHCRDSVQISFLPGKEFKDKDASVCLSVVPEGMKDLAEQKVNPLHIKKIDTTFFIPETRGLTLTGRVLEKTSRKPVSFDRVNLSIMGEIKDYISVLTDSAGRFYFPLPNLDGKRDLFIFADNKDGIDNVILVDNDFCTNSFELPSASFHWKQGEENAALEAANNKQISELFQDDATVSSEKPVYDSVSFYGTPSKIVMLDKYIQLPSLEEYVNEFLPEIRIRKTNGRKSFYVFGPHSELTVYPPLLLIDLIAVPDAEKILKMSPEKISRIEILSTPYIKGDMIYGGIISFFSKKGDFAGIDLSSSGIFLRYNFLDPADEQSSSSYINNPHFPDSRTTLYWVPSIPLIPGKPFTAWFRTSDQVGTYSVVLQGSTTKGESVSATCSFQVR